MRIYVHASCWCPVLFYHYLQFCHQKNKTELKIQNSNSSVPYGLWHAALSWDWYWKGKFNSFTDAREVSPREILLFYCSNFYALLKRHPLLPLDGFCQGATISTCTFQLSLSSECVPEPLSTFWRISICIFVMPVPCQNNHEHSLQWWRLMRFTVRIMMMRHVQEKNQWLSSSNAFFFPSIFLSFLKSWSLQKNKEVWFFFFLIQINFLFFWL